MSAGYTLEADASLRALNTFGVEARAAGLLTVHESGALPAALADPRIAGRPLMCLGEGSNLLLVGDYPGVMLRQAGGRGHAWSTTPARRVRVRAEAGCAWDALVDWTLSRGLAGLENLALIPGLVGAAPIQNIGAYGTEIDEFIATVEAWDRASGRLVRLPREDCGFTYRDSRFKHEIDRWIVTALELRAATPAYAAARLPRRARGGRTLRRRAFTRHRRRRGAAHPPPQAPGPGRDRQRRQLLQESGRRGGPRACARGGEPGLADATRRARRNTASCRPPG